MADTRDYCVKGSYMEHSKHANLILQRASTNTLLGIERQRKLVLSNLMRQKRLVENELCSHRDAPVSSRGGEVGLASPLSRQETRAATLRREAIALGGNTLSVHHFGQPVSKSEPLLSLVTKKDDSDSSDEEDTAEASAPPAPKVDLLFEGLTISRRTRESLKRNEEMQEERKLSVEHSASHDYSVMNTHCVDELPRSASKPKTAKIVSFQESRNQTYLYCDPPGKQQTPKSPIHKTIKAKEVKRHLGDRNRLVKSAYPSRSTSSTSMYTLHKVPISAPPDRRFPFDVRRRPSVPPASMWTVHKYGRLYRRSSATRPHTTPEKKRTPPVTSQPRTAVAKFVPWAAYKFQSVEQNQTDSSPTGDKLLTRRQSVTKPRRGETVLHLRKVDQSRENSTVLVKVERFLGRHSSGGVVKKGVEEEDTSGSDVIDEEEDQMIQMSRRGR